MTAMRRSGPAVEQLIGALIPQPLPRPSPEPPPLPTLPPPRAPSGADSVELDVARLDRAGRCSARTLLRRLDWTSEHRFGVDVIDGTILIQRHPRGRLLVDTRGALTLPAAPRQLCGISSGDQIVLAADLRHGRVTVYPVAMIARLLAEHHMRLAVGRRGR
jgi:hypothetical protein